MAAAWGPWPCGFPGTSAAGPDIMLRRMFHSKLTRELTFVVILKVLLLTLIWMAFVRGQRVQVDGAGMAAALRLNETQTVNTGGDHHDQ